MEKSEFKKGRPNKGRLQNATRVFMTSALAQAASEAPTHDDEAIVNDQEENQPQNGLQKPTDLPSKTSAYSTPPIE